ncbi:B3 domain-containing protein REM13 [Hirschfeldia incana]|nr:B3 domain-containing protein REM13 [Hirschfeldia incana]KAJ0232445.1 B3 domain-containing protein REM13 [Hirschfeldia incana]
MTKSTLLLRPQFFHTLLPSFQTQLMIPSDFFSNYIKDLETTTAEVKSDSSSDITWKVKLTGRVLNDGWGDFAVANNLRIGHVVLVRYEGDMVFHVSDLGPSCSHIQHIKPPRQNTDDDGRFLLRKHPRTYDFEEVNLNKKVKINSNETKADSSFSVDNSFSLHTDTLCLPQHLTRNCSEVHSTEINNEEEDIERERKEDESLLLKKKCQQKPRPVSYSSCSPCHKRFVTFTLPPDYATICRLTLPNLFVKENGINKPGETCVLGKDGTKWPVSLLLDKKGIVSLGKGWKEFVKANGLETGFTLKLMWEDTTPSFSLCCPESASDKDEEQYLESIKKQSLSIDRRIRDKISKDENKKEEKRSWEREKIHLGGRYVGDFEEVPVNKKVKTDSHGSRTEAVSSSLDYSCFVAFVTDWSLDTDTLYLPRYFTCSNGLTRKCRKIVLIDGGGRSWELDLRFNESSDIFFISPGWRSFCDENGLEAGGFFTFKQVGNGETPVLSFGPMESIESRRQTDCSEAHSTEVSNEEEDMESKINEDETLVDIEKKGKPKQRPVSYSSYSPCYKRFITFTLPPDYTTLDKLTLPKLFVKENGINRPGEIYLSGRDGTKWLTRLLLDKKGLMRLGKGWKDFVKANGVELGFTLKLMWEELTPSFSLCCAGSASDKDEEEYLEVIKQRSLSIDGRIRDKISNDKNNKEGKRSGEREKINIRGRDSTTSRQKQFLTLAISPTSLLCNRLRLPMTFLRGSSMDKPGVIYLLGKDDTKWMANLIQEGDGRMKLGKGWRAFAKENEFKPGESVTLESIWEDETPMIRFLRTEYESSKANKKESIYTEDIEPRTRDSSLAIHDRFLTLTLTHEDVKACMLILPSQFLKANGINKLGKIILLDNNGVELSAYLLSREGIVALACGWGEFCEANGVKLGESFTLECIKEQDGTAPVLKLCSQETNE